MVKFIEVTGVYGLGLSYKDLTTTTDNERKVLIPLEQISYIRKPVKADKRAFPEGLTTIGLSTNGQLSVRESYEEIKTKVFNYQHKC